MIYDTRSTKKFNVIDFSLHDVLHHAYSMYGAVQSHWLGLAVMAVG